MLSYAEQQAALNEALAPWAGKVFSLRAFPGKVFRVGVAQSYYSECYGIMLYTQRLVDGCWCDFAKGTPEELASQATNIRLA